MQKPLTLLLLGVSLVLATTPALSAAGGSPAPTAQSEPAPTLDPAAQQVPEAKKPSFLDSAVAKAFTKGTFSLNARLRYEYAYNADLDPSNAVTIRPRFGFTTAPLHGFQGMLEAENVSSLGAPYNDGVDPDEANRTFIPDPPATEINQAWVSYNRWESLLKLGRQRIVLDNQRFVGDVAWRQNMQTFDGIQANTQIITNAWLFYSYLYRIERIMGNGNPGGSWNSNSHLVNGSYEFCNWAKLTGYGYFLDFGNSPAIFNSNTGGGSVTGQGSLSDKVDLSYRAEFAWQTLTANAPDYSALYYTVSADATFEPFSAGIGYEVLGSDDGAFGFQTPLATLHKFNGWADVFVVTPNAGLQDLYFQAGVKLPGDLPFKLTYHKFWSDEGGANFGQEIDAMITRQFGKYFSVLAAYAYYAGASGRPNVQRFWLAGTFNY